MLLMQPLCGGLQDLISLKFQFDLHILGSLSYIGSCSKVEIA